MADIEPFDADAYIAELGKQSRAAARKIASAPTDQKNKAIVAAADALIQNRAEIEAANREDVTEARTAGKPDAFIDRLMLNADRIAAMADAMHVVAELPDPVGRTLADIQRPNGLNIRRIATPIGVIGMIYESRPNVGADASALCLKSGNAIILRGGSDSRRSSRAIVGCVRTGLREADLPAAAVQMIDTPHRSAVGALLRATDVVDLVIPRGGKSLVQLVRDEARVPTLLHLDGNCHSYVHAAADIAKAVAVIVNAKQRRFGVCGATESIVVDSAIARDFLPRLVDALHGCDVRGDVAARKIEPKIGEAVETDWDMEYLDNILSVKVVENLDAAIDWVSAHSSGHTDAILTEDQDAADAFLSRIDSAVVMHNASTQFSDGGEFGMGAEIGIATGKIHARGPVGLEQLTTFKYQVRGDGQTRP